MPVDLDAAIDAVAREMTDAEPSGDLRARVLERIEQGRRRSAPAVPNWAWAGAAAAVVLAVATAVWLSGPVQTPRDTQPTLAALSSGRPSAPAAGAGSPATRLAASADVGLPAGVPAEITRTSRRAARGEPALETDVSEDRHPVPALAEIEPLRFSAVEPGHLQIAALEVAPLPAMRSIDLTSIDLDSRDIKSADPTKEKQP